MKLDVADKFLLVYLPVNLLIGLIGGMIIIWANTVCAACSGCGCLVRDLGWYIVGLLLLILFVIGISGFVYLKKKK